MLMPGRHANTSDYRYGFNNMELDNEIKGEGNSYDFGSRSIYDGRVARFISLDPRMREFAHMSPYSFAGNNPIINIDKDGEFPWPVILNWIVKQTTKENALDIADKLSIEGKAKNTFMAYMGYMNGMAASFDAESASDALKHNFKSAVKSYVLNQQKIAKGEATFAEYMLSTNHFSSFVYHVGESQIKDLSDFAEQIYEGDSYAIGQGLAIGTQLLLTGKTIRDVKSTLKKLNSPESRAAELANIKSSAKQLSQRLKNLPEALQTRPKWRKSTLEYLEKNSPKDANGNYIDAKTGLPITSQKHIGHLYESWREYQDNPSNHGKTREQVINDYNNVENVGYQDGSTNSSDGARTKGLENPKG